MPVPKLDSAELALLREFWRAYAPVMTTVSRDLRIRALGMPAFASLVPDEAPEVAERRDLEARERLRLALDEDDWRPFLEHLEHEGSALAHVVPVGAWRALTAEFRRLVLRRLAEALAEERVRMTQAIEGLAIYERVVQERIAALYLRIE